MGENSRPANATPLQPPPVLGPGAGGRGGSGAEDARHSAEEVAQVCRRSTTGAAAALRRVHASWRDA